MTKLTLILTALALGLAAVPASAASPRTIIQDCSSSVTGELQGSYSKRDLRTALKDVQGDVAEYTSCADAINHQLRQPAQAGGDGGSPDDPVSNSNSGGDGGGADGGLAPSEPGGDLPGGGAGAPAESGERGAPTAPAQPAAPVARQAGSGEPVQLAGASVTPSIPATLDSDGRSLPPALIAFLAVLAAGALGVAATTIGRRVLARRRL